MKIRQNKEVDMSPEALASRLEQLGQLYRLGQSLLTAKPIDGHVEGAKPDVESGEFGEHSESHPIEGSSQRE